MDDEMKRLLKEMEDRIISKIKTSQSPCEFSEVYQGFLKCFHDLRHNEMTGRKELLNSIEQLINELDHFIVALSQQRRKDH